MIAEAEEDPVDEKPPTASGETTKGHLAAISAGGDVARVDGRVPHNPQEVS